MLDVTNSVGVSPAMPPSVAKKILAATKLIQPGEKFFYYNPGDGKGGWRCCKACHAERQRA